MQLTGAEIVVRCLQEEGVEHVFGYPGGSVLFIYDELSKQDKVKHVLVRHEQGAVHHLPQFDGPPHPVLTQHVLERHVAENVVERTLVDGQPGIAGHGDRTEHFAFFTVIFIMCAYRATWVSSQKPTAIAR